MLLAEIQRAGPGFAGNYGEAWTAFALHHTINALVVGS